MLLFQFDQKSLPPGIRAAYNDLSIILMSQFNVYSYYLFEIL